MPLFAKLQILLDKINRVLREMLTGIRVIRAFNRSGFEEERADTSFRDYAQSAIRINRRFAILMPLIMIVMNICTVLIIALGGQRVAEGQMQIGDIMALIEYTVLILMYLIMGIMVFMIFPRAQSCADRVNEVLSVSTEADLPAKGLPQHKHTAKLEFKNVTFQYQGAEEPVLNNISFTADIGKTTAIIGGTGSGKSTIASLIPRFYDIQSGSIRIDGINIFRMSKQKLREKIGYVPQKAFLFSGTILDNFRHGKKNATMDEIRHAAKIAQIDDFIAALQEHIVSSCSRSAGRVSNALLRSCLRLLRLEPEPPLRVSPFLLIRALVAILASAKSAPPPVKFIVPRAGEYGEGAEESSQRVPAPCDTVEIAHGISNPPFRLSAFVVSFVYGGVFHETL